MKIAVTGAAGDFQVWAMLDDDFNHDPRNRSEAFVIGFGETLAAAFDRARRALGQALCDIEVMARCRAASTEERRKGRSPEKMLAAAAWLTTQPQLMALLTPDISYRSGGPYSQVNPAWRSIADAVRVAGFFSRSTGTIDVPVNALAREALRLVQESSKNQRAMGARTL